MSKEKRRSAEDDRVRLHVAEWDSIEFRNGELIALFRSAAGQFELVLTPGTTIRGINLATRALVKGGVLPKAPKPRSV